MVEVGDDSILPEVHPDLIREVHPLVHDVLPPTRGDVPGARAVRLPVDHPEHFISRCWICDSKMLKLEVGGAVTGNMEIVVYFPPSYSYTEHGQVVLEGREAWC